MPDIQHKRGSRANLNTLAVADGLLIGQIYVITDENRLAVATTTGTYQAMAKEGEGGEFSPRCYSRAVNRAYCLNLKGNDHGYYSIY